MRRTALVWLVALALGLSVASLTVAPVRAAAITVTTTADEMGLGGAGCGLREAIVGANTDTAVGGCAAGSGADVITLPAGTYVLDRVGTGEDASITGDLDVTGTTTIVGAGAATTIIDAGDIDRVFHILGSTVAMSGVTIRNGSVADVGGGIAVAAASLSLSNAVVSGNASTTSVGGGFFIIGSVTLTGVDVSGNTSMGVGGGFFVEETSTLTITGGAVSGNSTQNNGGGIFNTGTATLTNVTVSGNSAPGVGGGMFAGQAVTLTGVTVSGNSAISGGGIYFPANGSLTIRNSTISGNTASTVGAGLFTDDDALIEFSTITNNTSAGGGGSGLNVGLGTVDLFATIIALNSGDECVTEDGVIDSLGNNLASDATCELDGPNDRPSVLNPMLGPLASNGGTTQTHALLAGSVAIDAVQLAALQVCIGTDQRGTVRPQDGDGNATLLCDIGAYELQAAVAPTPVPTGPAASALPNTTTSGPEPLAVGVLSLVLAVAAAGVWATRIASRQGSGRELAELGNAKGQAPGGEEPGLRTRG